MPASFKRSLDGARAGAPTEGSSLERQGRGSTDGCLRACSRNLRSRQSAELGEIPTTNGHDVARGITGHVVET